MSCMSNSSCISEKPSCIADGILFKTITDRRASFEGRDLSLEFKERVTTRNCTVNIHLGVNPSDDLDLGGQQEVTSSGIGISSCIDSLDLKRAIIEPPQMIPV